MTPLQGTVQRLGGVLCLGLTLFGTSTMVLSDTQVDGFIQEPGEETRDGLRKQFSIELINGVSLHLTEVMDSSAQTLGYVVREHSPAGAPRVSQLYGLRGVNPVDLLWAFTDKGEAIPPEVKALYGEPDSRQPQGWARTELTTKVDPPQGTGVNCNDYLDFVSFASEVTQFGYGLTFLSENDGPQTKPLHWYDEPNEVDPVYHRLTGAAYGVSAFYAQVRYYCQDITSTANPKSPWWGYDYRVAGGPWENIDGDYLDDPGAQDSFWWHPVESNFGLPADTSIDFRIRVGRVLPQSLFWIGATWSKPFDTLKGN